MLYGMNIEEIRYNMSTVLDSNLVLIYVGDERFYGEVRVVKRKLLHSKRNFNEGMIHAHMSIIIIYYFSCFKRRVTVNQVSLY